MTHSPLTDDIQITSESSSRPSKIDRFIIHHAATTSLSAILSLFQPGGRTVSANYALGSDGTLVLAVDEDRRAWTSASEYWDGRAVTIEVANSYAGDPWPVSDAAFDKLARLIADVSVRYDFPINDDTILTHQELFIRYGDSYATACPGDLQRRKPELLASANRYRAELLGGQISKELKVKHYHVEDRTATVLQPGDTKTLRNARGQNQNVVGDPGPYSITAHIYAEGTPGDQVDVMLNWAQWKLNPVKWSPHYTERLTIGADGSLRTSVEFKRSVGADTSVVLQAAATNTNANPVTVTVLDSDAFLFIVA